MANFRGYIHGEQGESFALHTGDLINKSHTDRAWAERYKAGGFLHAQWRGIPVIGNHEYIDTT